MKTLCRNVSECRVYTTCSLWSMCFTMCGFSGVSVWMPELQQLFGLYSVYWLRIILNTGSSTAPQWIASVNKRYVEWGKKKSTDLFIFYFFTCCGVVLWCTGLFPKLHHNILVSLPTLQTHIWFRFTPILCENPLAESDFKQSFHKQVVIYHPTTFFFVCFFCWHW